MKLFVEDLFFVPKGRIENDMLCRFARQEGRSFWYEANRIDKLDTKAELLDKTSERFVEKQEYIMYANGIRKLV